jgi:hypothetical protein
LALAVLLVVSGASAIAENDNASEQLAGTWLMKIEVEGVGIITYVAQFSKDGRMVAFFPSGEPQGGGFADTRTACPGEWRAAGEREYEFTHYCLWSAWDYGMVPDRIRSRLTLDKKGQAFTAPFSYEYWDVQSQKLVLEAYGVSYGTRLGVVPYK